MGIHKYTRVLVTGGAGFIGGHTANLLVNSGYDVTIIDSLSPKVHGLDFPAHLDKRINMIHGDIRNVELMTELIGQTDYIIHLAAEMDLNPDFSLFMDVNVTGTASMYEIIVKNNFKIRKILIASSQFVYGDGIWNCSIHGDFYPNIRVENDLNDKIWDHLCPICKGKSNYKKNSEEYVNPPNHYALSKYFQEQIGLKLGKLYNIPTTALRYSIVHGPFQSLKNTYSGALRNFAISMKLNRELSSFEDNCSERDFISVRDVAAANLFLMECNSADYEVYNVGGEVALKIHELAYMLSSKFELNYKFSDVVEYRKGDIRHAISSTDKLLKLGWKYTYSEDKALEDYVNWFNNEELDINRYNQVYSNLRSSGIVKKII